MAEQKKRSKGKFPKKFLWGTATAAHQVEGGLHNQWTVWELENAKRLAAQAPYQFDDVSSWPRVRAQAVRPENYVSGRGVEHERRYEDDFSYLSEMSMNAFRFGIEWARVEPEEGVWDAAVIAHYRRYLRALKARGITPVVTLFHFTLPVWFSDKGGFEKRRNVRYFTRYAEKIIDELGGDMEWIITINEPTVYVGESYLQGSWPPQQTSKWRGVRVLGNLIAAHKQVYRLTMPRRRLKVSMAHHVLHFYPGDDARLSRWSAFWADYVANQYTIRRVRKQSDFLAINHYLSYRIFGYRAHNSEVLETSDLGWDLQPEKLYEVLTDLYERYRLPLFITENGLADAEDTHRQWWLTETLQAMHRALKDDVKLIGYLHWSLLDNFEWDKGYWPRFGLVAVDRQTMERTLRPSGRWFGSVIRKLRQ